MFNLVLCTSISAFHLDMDVLGLLHAATLYAFHALLFMLAWHDGSTRCCSVAAMKFLLVALEQPAKCCTCQHTRELCP